MIRALWRTYLGGLALWTAFVVGGTLGPIVEERLFPIRTDQEVKLVERSAGRACWRWTSVKLRPAVSDNIDAFLVTAGDRIVVAPFDRQTGLPWRMSGSVQPGRRSPELCVLLPPFIEPDQALRVEQTIYYRGWAGLWHVRVVVPDVVSPGS